MLAKVAIQSIVLVFFTLGIGFAEEHDFDLLFRNAKVFDGSLSPAFTADVAVKDGRIVRVGTNIRGSTARALDATGLHLSPGFIDLHTHVDRGMYFRENRKCLNYLYQGVTTVVVGQCGSSAWNIFEQAEDQMNRWTSEGIGPNAALLVGHGTVRQIVMGREDRAPTKSELEKMKLLVKQAMEQGAYGLSTGLIYVPGSFSKTDELIALVKVIAPFSGIYHSHIRNENRRLLEAMKEAIEIGEKAGVQVHISHFKVIGKENWGSVKEACDLMEAARSRGLIITADQYPYRFSNNYPYTSLIPSRTWHSQAGPPGLDAEDIAGIFDKLSDSELKGLYSKVTPFVPVTARHQQYLDDLPRERLVTYVAQSIISTGDFRGIDNPRERMLFFERLSNPNEMKRIRKEVKDNIERTGAENLIVGICVDRECEGKSLREVAAMRGNSVEDTAIELELMGSKFVPYRMGEEDIEYIMKKSYVGTGSDGAAPYYGIGFPHPRSYSTFLHKIKKYALERKAVSVPHVIRSQTSLPAEIMKWNDRGWIKEGYKADIVLLDLDNLETKTSISNAHQYCKGVQYLVINGELVIDEGVYTGKLPGQVLKFKQ